MRLFPDRFAGWIAVVACIGFIAACQKVELPAEEGGNTPGQGTSVPGNEDDDPVVVPDDYLDAMTVAQVKAAYPDVTTDDEIFGAVIGYVVGYADRSVNNAVFSAEGAPETNILMADRRNETRPEHCLPVQLVKGTEIRNELNLAENPYVLGERVYMAGFISKYYGTVGMRKPEYYEWVIDEDDNPGDEEPAPDPEPDPGPLPDPEVEDKDTLFVDEEPVVIPGGRSTGGSGRKEKGWER